MKTYIVVPDKIDPEELAKRYTDIELASMPLTSLETAVKFQIGKEGQHKSCREDWSEIRAAIELGASREEVLRKVVIAWEMEYRANDLIQARSEFLFLSTPKAAEASMSHHAWRDYKQNIYERLLSEFHPKGRNQKPRTFEDWFKFFKNDQEHSISDALRNNAPVNAEVFDRSGLEIPEGYRKNDHGLYVFVKPPGRFELEYVKEEDGDSIVICPVCGFQGPLMSGFSYLWRGFNGIQPGDPDDLDMQECGVCEEKLRWEKVKKMPIV